MPITPRHFLVDTHLTPAEQADVLNLAQIMKAHPYDYKPLARAQTGLVVFAKTSTRTQVSYAVALAELGGNTLTITAGESQPWHKESIYDSAKVFERMVSIVIWRTYAQSGLEELASNSVVPVVKALTDDYHPCQVLAD